MSKVKTLQDLETETETYQISKKEFEKEMQNAKTIMRNMKEKIVLESGQNRVNKERFEKTLGAFQKLKSEYENVKIKLEDNKKQIEAMKKAQHVDIKGKYVSSSDEYTEKSIKEMVDKFYKEVGKKQVDEIDELLKY